MTAVIMLLHLKMSPNVSESFVKENNFLRRCPKFFFNPYFSKYAYLGLLVA